MRSIDATMAATVGGIRTSVRTMIWNLLKREASQVIIHGWSHGGQRRLSVGYLRLLFEVMRDAACVARTTYAVDFERKIAFQNHALLTESFPLRAVQANSREGHHAIKVIAPVDGKRLVRTNTDRIVSAVDAMSPQANRARVAMHG